MGTMEIKSSDSLNNELSVRLKERKNRHRTLLIIGGLLLLLVLNLFRPWGIRKLHSTPHPVQNYAEALREIEKLRAHESSGFNPVGKLRFMTHHRQVDQVIVFVHGYTNCPQQFAELGECFFKLDYNVLIAPLPHHGLADRMTKTHAKLTAEELISYSDRMVDIAQGLGKKVVMVGLSVGGNAVAWSAQTRSDLDLAVIMAPVFGYKQIPVLLTPVVTNLCLRLPNFFKWWEPSLKSAGGVPHSYPRFSSRAIGESLRLGLAIQTLAQKNPPAAHRILMVTNANDTSVHRIPITRMVQKWRKNGAEVGTYEFGTELQLGHDFIDPDQRNARVDLVYPRLIELIAR